MRRLREEIAALDSNTKLRVVADARLRLFSKVAELRDTHLKAASKLADRTRDSYADDARRTAAAGGDPAAIAGTYASFRKLRAACMWKAREDLKECLAKADRARKKGGSGDIEALCIYDETLPGIEQRIAMLNASQFVRARAVRHDKTHMQRHKLGRLPADWVSWVHTRTKDGIYGEAISLGILIPVRPSELASRIRVRLDSAGALVFEVAGSKVREKGSGVASKVDNIGQPMRWLKLSAVDPSRQQTFNWLSERVRSVGGELSIGGGLSASGISSAFRAMSKRMFPRHRSPPSFYALRHAACAELKASGLDVDAVACGMGHASALSQKAYGTASQGSGCYVIATDAAIPIRRPMLARSLSIEKPNALTKAAQFGLR